MSPHPFYHCDLNLDHLPDIEVVDIMAPQKKDFYRHFEAYLEKLPFIYSNDSLAANYTHLLDSLDSFLCFHVCFFNDQVVAFSGLMKSHYPNGCRALSRTFYDRRARAHSLAPHRLPNIATGIMLPLQVELGLKAGKNFIFVSLQGEKRADFIEELFAQVNSYWQLGQWMIPKAKYNTCRTIGKTKEINNSKDCWQRIAYLKYKDLIVPPLPSMDI
jgi:hypothetical protein